jgi:predicted nucleotidyltransferase
MILIPVQQQRLLEAQIRDIVGTYLVLSTVQLFFFGSRVDGSATERSDIDIGILSIDGEPIARFSIIAALIEEIDTIYKLQIVDFSRVSESFKTTAMQFIEPF